MPGSANLRVCVDVVCSLGGGVGASSSFSLNVGSGELWIDVALRMGFLLIFTLGGRPAFPQASVNHLVPPGGLRWGEPRSVASQLYLGSLYRDNYSIVASVEAAGSHLVLFFEFLPLCVEFVDRITEIRVIKQTLHLYSKLHYFSVPAVDFGYGI
ncbi:hypothetical protein FNV43_RR11017 [Rhamnella rubrinervis]|uniref:Uncharacterized protein n=1 Tax=Rhamnella rubrinervis TaxID=2594499 RepID=A0A8K0H517_9ROSA|nr:hypothetical protein FNV43_RR11017 [Rhamnella rubrinervis]